MCKIREGHLPFRHHKLQIHVVFTHLSVLPHFLQNTAFAASSWVDSVHMQFRQNVQTARCWFSFPWWCFRRWKFWCLQSSWSLFYMEILSLSTWSLVALLWCFSVLQPLYHRTEERKKTKATTQDSCIYDLGFSMYLLFSSGNYRLHLVSSGYTRTYIWTCSWYLRDSLDPERVTR